MTIKRISVLFGILILLLSLTAAASGRRVQDPFGVTPVAALGQHLIARTYVVIDPQTGLPGNQGSAALYASFLTGIPEPMFSSEPHNESTAYFTAVFSPFTVTDVIVNGSMTNQLFSANHEVQFYFDADPNQDFADFDTFSDGEHIATFTTVRNQANLVGTIGFFINSAKLTWSKPFVFVDGKTYDFRDLVPGGITVHILTDFTPIPDPANPGLPQIVPLPQLGGAPSIMFPFSGTGIHQHPQLEDVLRFCCR